jgi:hypothetical protein
VANNSDAKRRGEYRSLNRANLLPLRILNFLSKSPEEEFMKSKIQEATYDSWDRQEQSLKLLVDSGCVEEKDKIDTIGHVVYQITLIGRETLAKFKNEDFTIGRSLLRLNFDDD